MEILEGLGDLAHAHKVECADVEHWQRSIGFLRDDRACKSPSDSLAQALFKVCRRADFAAKADLVLVTASSPKLESKLRALDLPVKVLPDSSYEDVFDAIRELGGVTQRPLTARRLIDNLEADMARLEQPPAAHKRVLLVTGPMPIPATGLHVAGPGSVLDRFLQLAGCENAMAGRLERPWARISVEQVLAANPDIIIETRDPADEAHHDALYRAWSPIAAVNALRHRRIRTLPRWIELPGPRINVILYRIVVAVRD